MIIMNNQEKKIIKILVSDLKRLQETVSKNELDVLNYVTGPNKYYS